MSHYRTPAQQAEQFVRANRRAPATARTAENRQGNRWIYSLADGSRHRLGDRAVAMLPPGFPRWRDRAR